MLLPFVFGVSIGSHAVSTQKVAQVGAQMTGANLGHPALGVNHQAGVPRLLTKENALI